MAKNISKVLIILALFTFGGCLRGYAVRDTVTEDYAVPRIELNGHKIHSEAFGNPENSVVIFIHGGPGLDYKNALFFKELADEYRVVFYDQAGSGLSERVTEKELNLESSLKELDSIIDFYSRGRKVFLIGHSWGAMLAAGYIGQYPEKVSKAVLMEPGALNAEMLQEFIKKSQKMTFGMFLHMINVKIKALHYGNADAQRDYFMYEWTYGYKGTDNPYLDYYRDKKIPDGVKEHWRFGGLAAEKIPQSVMKNGEIVFDLTKGLNKFEDNVLFITSDSNKVTGIETQEKHMKFFKNAEMVIMENSGHYMFVDKPLETLQAIKKYLKK